MIIDKYDFQNYNFYGMKISGDVDHIQQFKQN